MSNLSLHDGFISPLLSFFVFYVILKINVFGYSAALCTYTFLQEMFQKYCNTSLFSKVDTGVMNLHILSW